MNLPQSDRPVPFIPSQPWKHDHAPKKILAIRLQAMGDMVITLPYLQYLRNHLPPETRIDLLTRVEVNSIPKSIQLFDHIYSIGGWRRYKLQVALGILLLPKLMLQSYDVVLDLQNNFISEMVLKAIKPKAWSVFDKASPIAAGERTRLTIEAAIPGKIEMDTRYRFKKDLQPQRILRENGWDGISGLVVLNPAAAFVTRNWPMENYVVFAKTWLEYFPQTQFVLAGTTFIKKKAHYLKQELGESVINLINKTTPAEVFQLLQQVRFVLSEDGGLMHMSWISGIPTLALFGGTRSDWARPLGPHSSFLDSSDLACGNCMKEVCQFGDVRCLTRYTPENVFHQAMELMQKNKVKTGYIVE